jgi:transcriptional regulator with PAS, ATPase and Fis domain
MDEKPQDGPPNMELAMIRNVLEQAHGDKARAARLLGISLSELQRFMRHYGLPFDGSPD